jgi:hypothetical protein
MIRTIPWSQASSPASWRVCVLKLMVQMPTSYTLDCRYILPLSKERACLWFAPFVGRLLRLLLGAKCLRFLVFEAAHLRSEVFAGSNYL